MANNSDSPDGRSSRRDCAGCENESCSGPEDGRRRNLLSLVAGGAAASLAGCTSLFTFGDEAEPRERPDVGTDTETPTPTDNGGNQTETDSGAETYSVRYLKQGETIEVPADKSLLVAGEEQGWDLPFNCRRGVCGQCTARLWGDARERVELDGNQVLDEEELADGFTLTCVGYPRSNFVIETGEQDALDSRTE